MFLIVDGSALLYRSYYALPSLSNQDGEPTGAIFGVLKSLEKLLQEHQPTRQCVIFDAPGPTTRSEWFSEYKSNRPAMPSELSTQLTILKECIAALGWTIISELGIEADDIIGTLCQKVCNQKESCMICTPDKDMAQLVKQYCCIWNDGKILDRDGIKNKFGVYPEQIADYLALIGDTADNIPGIPKVGPKTAAKWLNEYGNLDAIIAHSADFRGVVGENLRSHLGFLPMAKKLTTIQCHLVLNIRWQDMTVQQRNSEKLITLYQRLGFKQWLKEEQKLIKTKQLTSSQESSDFNVGSPPLKSDSQIKPPILPDITSTQSVQVAIMRQANDLQNWLHAIKQKPVCLIITTECNFNHKDHLSGIFCSAINADVLFIPFKENLKQLSKCSLENSEIIDLLKTWLESTSPKITIEYKEDRHILAKHNLSLNGVVADIMVMAKMLQVPGSNSFLSLVESFNETAFLDQEKFFGNSARHQTLDKMTFTHWLHFFAKQAQGGLMVLSYLKDLLEQRPKEDDLYNKVEHPLMDVLFRMEKHGMLIDQPALKTQYTDISIILEDLEKKAYSLAGESFNLNSPKQLGEILFSKLNIPIVKKTKSGTASTDESVLEKLAPDYPLPAIILSHRTLHKLKATYIEKLPEVADPKTSRIHSTFLQFGAITGRLSSQDPNLQNIPVKTPEGRKIRTAFIVPKGFKMVSADYSQIELRIMAHLSQDDGLINAFKEELDIHKATAAEVFSVPLNEVSYEQRRTAKAINFGLIYGMSAFGLAKQLHINRYEAQHYIDIYFNRYARVAQFMDKAKKTAYAQGFVETVFGRRLYLHDINHPQAMRRQAAERAAINAPMQGTVADLVKKAMIDVDQWLEKNHLQTKLILQVHDELIFEVPETELGIVKESLSCIMTHAAQLTVPLVVDIGHGINWDEAHS